MAERNHFGERLRFYRHKADKSLIDLSQATGKSVSYLSDVELGRKNPPKNSVVLALAELVRAPALELLELASRGRPVEIESMEPLVRGLAMSLARDRFTDKQRQAMEALRKALGDEEEPE